MKGGKMKSRWTAAFCLMMVLLVSLGGVTSAALAPAGAGPQEIQVTERDNGRAVDLNGEVLVLNLESNPSTGYGWQAAGLDAQILRQVDATEWVPNTPGKLGGSGTQVLRFAAVGKGQATLNLVYARPWETAAPAKSFSLEVNVAEHSRNVTYPQPAAAEPPAAAADGGALTALPSSYNWCSLGGCTPVRDQGNCGSCWAFGTVGPLESAILIQDGASKDLAEQYLVSCNTDGWGCDGGWWAHDYHQWKYPAGEPGPGAVYEADFPYTATDAACAGPYTHHETIADWAYIGSETGVPPVDAIKQAILDHGPVSAAVCVNTLFQLYTGGVFRPPFWPPCVTINHAIVLVGWDDSLGAWRLRNSWGPAWGEGGYMWIAYGKYFVGYSANYVVYQAPTPPAAPTNLAAAAVSHSQINLTWTDNATDETGFKIERCTGAGCSAFAQIDTVGANVTGYSNTGLAAATSYSYRVRATNGGGDSGYSNTATAVTAAPPAGAVLYLSSSTLGTAGGVAFADEDVLIKDMGTGAWSLFIDGSDLGLANMDIDAFEPQADGSILMSFDIDFTYAGTTPVDDSDIVRFTPTSTGDTTAGTWSWYFDGSDVGLSTIDEDVDALTLLPDGRLLISTLGPVSVTGASGADEDLLAFTPTALGATTSGTWALYFDGSDVGLSTTTSEDVNGVWVDAAGKIYLTTLGSFGVTGVSGDGSDIFTCTPGSLGSTTTCTWAMYWDGSANGFAGEDTDAVSIIP
jgi:C1A family cysteine protease